jgi:hypothetical protein
VAIDVRDAVACLTVYEYDELETTIATPPSARARPTGGGVAVSRRLEPRSKRVAWRPLGASSPRRRS